MSQQGILAGTAIAKAVVDGTIKIDPYREEQLNPMSYDLRLGRTVRIYADAVSFNPLGRWKVDGDQLEIIENGPPLDAAKDNPTHILEMRIGQPFLLKPGIGYLLHTEEAITTDVFEPILDGKSSIARLFLTAHQTAGYGDPGFKGQYTLEALVPHPLLVYPGMRIAQIRFHTIVGKPVLYSGNYVGEASMGPVSSRSWKQFVKDESGTWPASPNARLDLLLAEVERLRNEGKIPREMTRKARIDWVYGNLAMSSNHRVSREVVEAAADRIDAARGMRRTNADSSTRPPDPPALEPPVERTLTIIKPDAFERRGEIQKVILDAGFDVVLRLSPVIDDTFWRRFYCEHEGKPFFEPLVAHMASGPVLVLVLEGVDAIKRWRALMGPSDSRKAPEGTLRHRFGAPARFKAKASEGGIYPMWQNAVHGSDSPAAAAREIEMCFGSLQ